MPGMLDYLLVLRGHDWMEYREFDYRSDGQAEYIGAHKTHKSATSDEGWAVLKLYYDSNGNMYRWSGPLYGVADDRATFPW